MFKLTMKQSFFVGIALAGFLVIRSFFAHASADPEATTILKRWVVTEFQRYHLDRTDLALEQKSALLLEAAALDFSSISARGTAGNMVIRVEIKPNAALPPDTPPVRYFRMRHSLLVGWEQTPRTASPLTYFLAPFLL